ncbi:MAG TPA: hypothetical protein VNU64_20515 [Burkholderiales bacterium]|nr:hypothetical protein [Burkholderiales bacterium]
MADTNKQRLLQQAAALYGRAALASGLQAFADILHKLAERDG